MSFLHSIVIERRKFGPLGWCVHYQFNYSDLEASLLFIEGYVGEHLSKLSYNSQQVGLVLDFDVVKYMVCEVQYGGRITDDLDRELFQAYGDDYLKNQMFSQDNVFECDITNNNERIKIAY